VEPLLFPARQTMLSDKSLSERRRHVVLLHFDLGSEGWYRKSERGVASNRLCLVAYIDTLASLSHRSSTMQT
jgi:hypothetical protein